MVNIKDFGKMLEHRYVMVCHILDTTGPTSAYLESWGGWYRLRKEYVVHHIDGNIDNNDLSNLEIYLDGVHKSLHHRGKTGLRGTSNPFYGKTHSTETRDRISRTRKGTPAWNRGIPRSEAAKEKMRQKSRMAYAIRTEEEQLKINLKISLAGRGRVFSEEHKRKISAARKAYWLRRKGLLT